MKILILAALVVSVAGGPIIKTWTLDELEKIIYDKSIDPEQKPYLEEAYNRMIYTLFTNKDVELTQQVIPSPKGSSTWTLAELEKAIKDPATNPKYLKAIWLSYEYLSNTQKRGNKILDSIEVRVPAMDISTWTLNELNEAIVNPETNSQLIPYLETARTKLTSEPEFQNKKKISIVTKVGLVKQEQ